jgi:hypothetical protein
MLQDSITGPLPFPPTLLMICATKIVVFPIGVDLYVATLQPTNPMKPVKTDRMLLFYRVC